MINLSNPEIQFTLKAVRAASHLVAEVQAELAPAAMVKGDSSPVTIADYAAQAFIGQALLSAYPNDPLIGEEDSSALRMPEQAGTLASITEFVRGHIPDADTDKICRWIDRGSASSGSRYWTVDPIDGTKGFLRGMQYAVALALVVDGRVVIGALGCPNLNFEYLAGREAGMQVDGRPGSLLVAMRGEGTWAAPLDGDSFIRLHVSDVDSPSAARLLRSYESAHTNTGKIGALVDHLDVRADPVGLDSQAKYALLAAGRGDMLVRLLSSRQPDYKEKIWDQAAGAIIVEEAGGRISDLHGRTLDFTQGRTLAANRGVLASNGRLHAAALKGLEKIEA